MMGRHNHIDVHEHGDRTVVRFKEHPILDGWDTQVGDELCEIAGRADCSDLVLDFSEVQWLASAMLATLLRVYRIMESKGGTLTFSGLRPSTREVFVAAKLDQLFNIGSEAIDSDP